MKPATEKFLDPMNFRGDVSWRKARDLSNRSSVRSLEIEEDDLLVLRLESLNQCPKMLQGLLLVHAVRTVRLQSHFDFFETNERRSPHFSPNDYRRGRVVGDAVNPGLERASPFKPFEAQPKSDVDFLQEISPIVGIGLIGPGQPVERFTVTGYGLFVKVVLFAPDIRHSLT